MRTKFVQNIEEIPSLTEDEQQVLKKVGEKFKFRSNDYYNSLINWDDPDDPLRLLVLPHESELDEDYGDLDASGEANYTVVKGLQHKYPKTGLLLVSKVCAAYCRFCFRKRLFISDNDEVTHEISESSAYIRAHEEIESVVLTGGDPLLLSTTKLLQIVRELSSIPHIKSVRIDTKILAFDPFRIINDQVLVNSLAELMKGGEARVYFISHYTHPRELTPESVRALKMLQAADVTVFNQMPMLKGINDDANVLADLFSQLTYHGVTSYYVFIGRPILGNKRFGLPLKRAWEIFRDAISQCTGTGKTAKLVMSHTTGKIEVVGFVGDTIVLRYHQIPDSAEQSKLILAQTNGDEMWFDDLKPYNVEEIMSAQTSLA